MRFYTGQHEYYCGVDLHARTLYLCVLDGEDGTIRLHKRLPCSRPRFLEAIAPYRSDLVVGSECIFCWYWLADLCSSESIPFVLGHALYMKAIHGGKAKNDKIDSHKTAVLLRGGAFPVAFVYPREMRATRDLFRRRLFFVHKRAELFAHVRNTFHQYNAPAPPGQLLYKKNRLGLPDAFTDPIIRSTIEADFDLANRYDHVIRRLENTVEAQAQVHDPHALGLLRTIPGVGKVLALTLLYEIHHIGRFPSVQDFSSYSRLVKSEHSSDGKRTGSGGAKIGNAHLKWAFSEAAVLFLKDNPGGQAHLKRLQRKHGKGKALSILAARIGRSVYFMLKNQEAFDMNRFFA
jgi:transposase